MNEQTPFKPKPRLPRGFRDNASSAVIIKDVAFERIARIYKAYGFEALETPCLEYADALGKFLPDQDRPNEGVFSLADDDGQWVSLRYDLTAPLARYVAEHYQSLSKPFRRYQMGQVWRNEKPGPGRFREFTQFDADTVGSASPAADAELLMMFADVLKQFPRLGPFEIKLSNRKLLDGALEIAGVSAEESGQNAQQRGIVLRALDKLDRLGADGVRALLGKGRKDESGDFTEGACLSDHAIECLMAFASPRKKASRDYETGFMSAVSAVRGSRIGEEGIAEVDAILQLVRACGYPNELIHFDASIVRGLDYYTGAVFEAQVTTPITNDAGQTVIYGSIGGGGRYDDLIARFTGQRIPATGISIGVSRLLSILESRDAKGQYSAPLVVVLTLDKENVAPSFSIAKEIRHGLANARKGLGVRAEVYVGEGGMKAQLKYADKRGAEVAVIEGSDERARGEVTLKNLKLGAEFAKSTEDRAQWIKDRPAQISVKREAIVEEVRAMLASNGEPEP